MIYIKDSSLWETIKAVPDLLKGVDNSTDNLAYLTFSEGEITVENEEQLATNVDGDEGDSLPVYLKILPQYLLVYRGTFEQK
ncbi:hypothetical protein A5883_002354 [Enterococcus sp. 5B3_DIV0040]|nr:hypothetical protein A5883_002354 [Enterococcus sp. 5B3_DIV0040]